MINRFIEWSLRNRFIVACFTLVLVGLGVLSMFLYAIGGADGPIFDMYFIAPLVREGEIWRLVTWPMS